jgi:hypothetical protein
VIAVPFRVQLQLFVAAAAGVLVPVTIVGGIPGTMFTTGEAIVTTGSAFTVSVPKLVEVKDVQAPLVATTL